MGHLKTILTKTSFNGLPVFLILYFVGNTGWMNALFFTILLIGTAYIVGDLFLLPKVGNLAATAADVVLVIAFLWFVRQLGVTVSSAGIIYTAAAVALAEGLLYHPYLKRLVSMDSMGPKIGDRN